MKTQALAISLIGILIILTSINLISPKQYQINELSQKDLNKKITLEGTTSNVKIHENNFTVFNLNNQNNQIQITCNCPNIQNNQKIKVLGTLTKYKNTLQLEANKITVVI
tara:strand:+ start:81 stop:410 length:330 start_codon:yes stop_codon:yes gene_type:complete